jgi:hypothetical protein
LANPSFRHGLLMRNQGFIEFEMLEKQCWSYQRQQKTIVYKHFAHNLPIFLIGEIWLNIGIFHSKDVASVLNDLLIILN